MCPLVAGPHGHSGFVVLQVKRAPRGALPAPAAAHSPGSARVVPGRELDLSRRLGGRRGEFGLGVVLGQPPARSVDDDQTDHKKGDTGKDLDTTLLRLRGDLAGRREDQNEAEREQAIAEPVRLGLHDREHESSGGDQRDGPCRGREIAMGIAAAAPTAVPIAFPPIRSRLPIRTYKARIRIGSGTQ